MATFEEIMGGAADPYGANLYQRDGESLYDYFSRIRGAEDRAGLLGWRLGAKDKALGLEAEEEVNAANELGKLIKKQTGATTTGPSERENALGIPDPRYTSASAKNISLEDMARQMSGLDFDPTILMNVVPGGGSVASYLRSREVQSRLKDMGYTESQIEAMIDNPSILMSELGTNVNAGFVKEFDPLSIDGRGLFTRLTDGIGLTDRTNLDVAASKAGLFGPHTADVMMREMAADPLLGGASTVNPLAVQGAQAAIAREQDELARAIRKEELDLQAEAARAREAAAKQYQAPGTSSSGSVTDYSLFSGSNRGGYGSSVSGASRNSTGGASLDTSYGISGL